jgi:plasmid maintenance system antidote protein VapI
MTQQDIAELIREECEEASLDIDWLRFRSDLNASQFVSIIGGGPITERGAYALHKAFGMSAQFWLNLQKMVEE